MFTMLQQALAGHHQPAAAFLRAEEAVAFFQTQHRAADLMELVLEANLICKVQMAEMETLKP